MGNNEDIEMDIDLEDIEMGIDLEELQTDLCKSNIFSSLEMLKSGIRGYNDEVKKIDKEIFVYLAKLEEDLKKEII